MMDYVKRHPEKIWIPFVQHVELVMVTLLFSLVLASTLTLIAMRSERISRIMQQGLAILYAIPSLALFAMLIPITGLGRVSAVIVLTLYNQYLLLRNFTTGLREVEPAVVDAARGIGMTEWQLLFHVRLPLAKKAIFAGIRLAVVSTIGIGTIAAAINAGGLGTLLFDGMRTIHTAKIIWGSALSAGLAVGINVLLKILEERI